MKLLPSSKKQRKPRFFIRQVQGDSMLPGYKPGHIIVASGRWNALEVGDVVVIDHGGFEKIKRIHKIRGERLYVVGDNQANSTDSRTFGWLHNRVVVGRVIWPRTIEQR